MTLGNGGEHMAYTLGQAAEATGKAKSTIFKSIRAGRISACKDEFENWSIDPSELHRVYSPLPRETPGERMRERDATGERSGETARETVTIRELQTKLTLMEELLEQVRGERDRERQNHEDTKRHITALLAAPKEEKSSGGWLQRLFGSK